MAICPAESTRWLPHTITAFSKSSMQFEDSWRFRTSRRARSVLLEAARDKGRRGHEHQPTFILFAFAHSADAISLRVAVLETFAMNEKVKY
jgi:hypothetical protein